MRLKSRGFIAAAVIALFLGLFFIRGRERMRDFEVNYTAGARIARGETLYRAEDGHYQFKYSPFSAILYVPLAKLPLPLAKGIWFFIVLASSVTIFILSDRLVGKPVNRAWPAAVLPPLILAKYYLRELDLGQINAVITLLLVLMMAFLSGRKNPSGRIESGAGLLWGLASALKPYALVFLPYFLIKKIWRAFSAGILVLLAAFLSPVIFYGWSGNIQVHQEWRSSLSESSPPLFGVQDNISLVGFFTKWTGRSNLALWLALAGVLILALAVLSLIGKGKRVAKPEVLEMSLLLLLIPLISPLGWDYTFLAGTPAVILIIRHWAGFPKVWRAVLGLNMALIGLSFFDLMGRRLYELFMTWSLPTVNFLILVAYLTALRIRLKA